MLPVAAMKPLEIKHQPVLIKHELSHTQQVNWEQCILICQNEDSKERFLILLFIDLVTGSAISLSHDDEIRHFWVASNSR